MASAPPPMPPRQAMQGQGSAPAPSPDGMVAAPAPAQPSLPMHAATGLVLQVAQGLRQLKEMFPAAAPEFDQAGQLIRTGMMKAMQAVQPSETAAPPVG